MTFQVCSKQSKISLLHKEILKAGLLHNGNEKQIILLAHAWKQQKNKLLNIVDDSVKNYESMSKYSIYVTLLYSMSYIKLNFVINCSRLKYVPKN